MKEDEKTPVYSEVDRHIGETWFALKPFRKNILRAEVKPLTEGLIDELTDSLVGHDPTRRSLAQQVRAENAALLASTDSVVLILDGRSNGIKEGYFGDMIEASRFGNALRADDKRVVIATPHQDLFQGSTENGVSCIPIPEDIWAAHTAPWTPDFLKYLHDSVGDTPCIFPMNANMPILIQAGKDGSVKNIDLLNLAKEAFRPHAQTMRITPTIWGKKGIHQLQALQMVADLLGIEEARKWQEFPQAFLHPTKDAQKVAQEVIQIYGCFGNGKQNTECPPLYLHPGVATNDNKLTTKFYPEKKWVSVIQKLAAAPNVANSLTFLEPTDPTQGAMTLRLATTAVEAGLHVAKVPMSSVKKQYEWTLGAFIAFLQELSKHKGIIVGCDSMPAGHAGPATGNPAVVLGSLFFNPGFFCPPDKALIVTPSTGPFTSGIKPDRIVTAIQSICLNPNLQYKH